jgi:hypothetical protein
MRAQQLKGYVKGVVYDTYVSERPVFFLFLNFEDVTDKLSRNVGKKLPLLAAY